MSSVMTSADAAVARSVPVASAKVMPAPAPVEVSAPKPVLRKPRRHYDKVLYPVLVALVLLGAWQGAVTYFKLPPYLVPSPILMLQTLVTDWQSLGGSLLFTLKITMLSFAALSRICSSRRRSSLLAVCSTAVLCAR